MESYEFERLFSRYSGRFIAYASTYVGRDTAQDMVMDAFLYYWERRERLDGTNPPAYILSTVKHRCLNYLQSRKTRAATLGRLAEEYAGILDLKISTLEALDPEDIFPDNIQSDLHKAIDMLPARTREIFILNRVHGHPYKDVARKLSMTVKGVEFELTKATRLLRKMLK
jgi:RNA polymerase sigma-70 factor (ECF subfamily)